MSTYHLGTTTIASSNVQLHDLLVAMHKDKRRPPGLRRDPGIEMYVAKHSMIAESKMKAWVWRVDQAEMPKLPMKAFHSLNRTTSNE